MLELNHEKSIKFICCLVEGKWEIKSITIDLDVDDFLKRNKFVLIKDSSLPPAIHMGRILRFLYNMRMDGGSVFHKISPDEEEFVITLKTKTQHHG